MVNMIKNLKLFGMLLSLLQKVSYNTGSLPKEKKLANVVCNIPLPAHALGLRAKQAKQAGRPGVARDDMLFCIQTMANVVSCSNSQKKEQGWY